MRAHAHTFILIYTSILGIYVYMHTDMHAQRIYIYISMYISMQVCKQEKKKICAATVCNSTCAKRCAQWLRSDAAAPSASVFVHLYQ